MANANPLPQGNPEAIKITDTMAVVGTPMPQPSVRLVQGAYAQLEQALAAGPRALRRQMHALVACWQASNTPNVKPLPVLRPFSKYDPMIQMAPYLSRGQVMQLVQAIHDLPDDNERIPLLVDVAAYLPSQQAIQIMRLAWIAVQDMPQPYSRARTLLSMARLLRQVTVNSQRENGIARILSVAQRMRNPDAFIRSLVVLAPHLPEEISVNVQRSVLNSLKRLKNDTFSGQFLVALAPHLPKQLQAQAMELAFRIKLPTERLRALVALAQSLPGHYRDNLLHAALETIDRVESESARAQMLTDFVPALDMVQGQPTLYGELVDKVTTSAVLISRRALRARVLVAIAAHVGADMHGAALADLHNLDDERECALLLQNLAPHLSSNMLVASLAVVHTMRDESARADSLCTLAHYIPESARLQTVKDALEAASSLPNPFERVKAYIALMDALSPDLKEQTLVKAVETAQTINSERTQARALTMLSAYLPVHLLSRAADILAALNEPEVQVSGLIGIYEALDEEERDLAVREMLLCASRISAEYRRAQALVHIAPYVPAVLASQLMDMVRDIHDPADKAQVLLAAAAKLPIEVRGPFLRRAQATCADIEDGYDQAAALALLIPMLPANIKERYQDTILEVINRIEDDYDKASAIALLAPIMANEQGHPEEGMLTLPASAELLRQGLAASLQITDAVLREQCLGDGLQQGLADGMVEDSFALWSYLLPQIASLPSDTGAHCVSLLMPLVRMMMQDQGARMIATELANLAEIT